MSERNLFLELAIAMREKAELGDGTSASRYFPDKRKQARCDELQRLLTEQWAQKYRLKQSRGRRDWKRLVWRQSGDFMEPLPGDDHTSLWYRDGKAAVYISQPYGIAAETLAKMQEACRVHGLAFDVSTWPAWHYPGSVLFVTWHRAGFKWYEAA